MAQSTANTRESGTMRAAGLLEAARRFWLKSYAGDYLGLIVIAVVLLVGKLIDEPFHQMFLLSDPRIQHPHAEIERVSVPMLFLYAALVPLAALIIWTSVYRPEPHKTHVTILGLATSILSATLITDILKDAVGRPRPDLIARCRPDPSAPRSGLVTIAVCQETAHHLLHDGWRSFPSGHSSFAFAGLGWLALFFASQTFCLRPRTSLTVALICLAPLLGAALIAASRLADYRHDVFDVVIGSLLGFAVAVFNWKRYFPSLLAKNCDEPYRLPGSGSQSPGGTFQRVRDEEDRLGELDDYSGGEDGPYIRESAR